jgi:hypothetical protein
MEKPLSAKLCIYKSQSVDQCLSFNDDKSQYCEEHQLIKCLSCEIFIKCTNKYQKCSKCSQYDRLKTNKKKIIIKQLCPECKVNEYYINKSKYNKCRECVKKLKTNNKQ